jgi:hypothetical protein
MMLHTDATGDGHTVGCDLCTDVLDPGELASLPGPWTEAEARREAERRGWLLDPFGMDLCPVHVAGGAL